MVKLTINNQQVEVPQGTTVLDAARQLGIQIPTMCHLEGTEHFTSCMICLVKDARNGRFFPSCSTPAQEGMILITDDADTCESRKAALELLLSDHVGDCEAPCQLVCPAHMNIPLMNRYIMRGDYAKALQVVKRDIALPAILGRICPAPCEAGCRRKSVDEPVAICHLKQFVADEDLKTASPYFPAVKPTTGKKIAVVGAGPAGLAVAYYLQLSDHQVTVFDRQERAGGDLLKIEETVLPKSVVDAEVAVIARTGVEFLFGQTVDAARYKELKSAYDALVLAVGTQSGENVFGLKAGKQGIEVDKATFQTSDKGVFAIGNALRASKLAVRSVGQGKELARIIDEWLHTGQLKALPERFNSKFGKLEAAEIGEYLKESVSEKRGDITVEFIPQTAMAEAERCLHCDCRKPESCKLRNLSDEFNAVQKRFQTSERKLVTKQTGQHGVVSEAEKCIKCGICVRLTRQHGEAFGFTFIGRGFDVQVGIPFNENLQLALAKTAEMVANACPTGALSLVDAEEDRCLSIENNKPV